MVPCTQGRHFLAGHCRLCLKPPVLLPGFLRGSPVPRPGPCVAVPSHLRQPRQRPCGCSWSHPGLETLSCIGFVEKDFHPLRVPVSRRPALDDLLRCGICYDYYNIAMIIPQCSHNFCSLCIRQSLSSKTHCPACFVAASESDLRNNRLLDDLVRSFGSARQQLLQLVQDARQTPSPLGSSRRPAGSRPVRSAGSWPVVKEEVPPIESFFRKAEVCASTTADGLAGTVQKILNTEQHHSLDSTAAEADGRDDELGSRESPECAEGHEKPSTSLVKAVRKVECPVCGVAIPEQYINKHLDSCLASEEKKDSLRSSAHKRKPLAKVVYNLLSDRDLKRKLKEHGLSTRGSRQQLVRRHQEFVHMYNAQCDALTPKSVAEIVKELEKNEKVRLQLEFNKTGENSLTFTKDQTEEEIDEIHTDYRNKHRSEFQFLVEQVNKRWKKSGLRKTESAGNKEEVAVTELPAGTAERAEEHPPAAGLGAPVLKAEAPDGSGSEGWCLQRPRSVSPALSLSSGSTSSSSSDILRDLQEPETCSASSVR
ncbi:E3 ubiquitin-protein ligase RAD18 isoform A [Patagioenas fasciata monilis]|uniref:RING-type E3 ubiquitin transferase n=1 Tax=Patagioenas fasciata monilis TaxID=372326 RepID=A0A1V4JIW5_PATFA|nr:E3 ubiquitin-protein ligase RAD18 isoform A [Patagioenas fasciata monilis]